MAAAQNGFTCPLCQISVQPPASFEKHVDRHLEELALFVLPLTDLSEEANSEESSRAASAIAAGDDSNQSIRSGGIESDVGPVAALGLLAGSPCKTYRVCGRPCKPTYPSRNRVASPPKDIRVSEERQGIEAKPPTDADTPPKEILKPARDKFPEVHNLRDVLKKGIPPGARWTKINRRFVNPAALEAGHERFEERPDYVIVLRVLSKEEIQSYALKTQDIRRHARYQEYLERRRHGDQCDLLP
ncbi:hypothetical protein CNMCM6069_004633 [Aspergillus lentulus]|nr:hypothetical protein CNMCM6069_004633 [Aspergillus lentulus]